MLGNEGDDVKVLAGGQSLVPLLNFRLAAPAVVVDINQVPGLGAIERRDGKLHIGAMTRQSAIEASGVVSAGWPLLGEAIKWVAHSQIRNRGTVGGSIAHADPAAELPVVMRTLDAEFNVRSRSGTRTIAAQDMFITHLTTSLEPDELLTSIELPASEAKAGWAFREFSRRRGDFALGGVALKVGLDSGGGCTHMAATLLAAGDVPIRVAELDDFLLGREPDEEAAIEFGAKAAELADPSGDMHGSARYRRFLISNLVKDATLEAADRARKAGQEQ